MRNRASRLLQTLGVASLLYFVSEQNRAQDAQPSPTRGPASASLPTYTVFSTPSVAGASGSSDSPTDVASGIYRADQRMVTLHSGADAGDVARGLGLHRVATASDTGLHLFAGPADALALLSAHPGVESSTRVGVILGAGKDGKKDEDEVDEDDVVTEATSSTGTEAASGTTGASVADLQWHLAGANSGPVPEGLREVVVAVVDSGVAYRDWCGDAACEATDVPTHRQAESLAETLVVSPADFVDGDLLPLDEHQHGTHIATTLLGNGAIQGVAPGASLMPIRVLDAHNAGTEFALIQGIHHAVDHGADIINMSLSFRAGFAPSPYLLAAIRRAHDEGVLLLAASGNEGIDQASWPASSPRVLSVGASAPESDFDQLSNPWAYFGIAHLAPYSNASSTVDLVAPGGDLSVDLTGDGHPDGILAETIFAGDPSRTGYYFFEGTSQATAIAAGAAARAMAHGATADQAAFALQQPARMLRGESSLDGVGRGYLDIARSEAAVTGDSAAIHLNRDVEVAVVPYLERGDDGRVRPAARLTAIGAANRFGKAVWLLADIAHRGDSRSVGCWTDQDSGQCTVVGEWTELGGTFGEAWTVTIAGVHYPEGVIGRPTGVLFATDALEAMLQAGDAQDVLPDAFGLGVFWDEGADDELGELAASFTFVGGGSGLATCPLAVIATPAAVLPGVLVDDPTGSEGTGLATSPLGLHTFDLDQALSTLGTGLATSPLGFVTLDLASLDGTGLATSPLGFTSVTFRPSDLNLDGTGLATSPLGWAPLGTLSFEGIASDGSTTHIVAVDGTGLATSPLGFHGADLLQPGGGGADLLGASLEGGVMVSDRLGSADGLGDSTVGELVDHGGFVSGSGHDIGALLGADTLTAPLAGDLAGPPVLLAPAQ